MFQKTVMPKAKPSHFKRFGIIFVMRLRRLATDYAWLANKLAVS